MPERGAKGAFGKELIGGSETCVRGDTGHARQCMLIIE